MTREELQKQMKSHLEEYTKLKSELEILTKSDSLTKISNSQTAMLNLFKERYAVTASLDAESSAIDFSDIEAKVLSSSNIESLWELSEGYSLTYNETGMPGLFFSSRTTSNFTPFAVDERDASLYKERERRRLKMAASRNR